MASDAIVLHAVGWRAITGCREQGEQGIPYRGEARAGAGQSHPPPACQLMLPLGARDLRGSGHRADVGYQ